ncbi:hypothetical protein B0T19DRAFT_483045 [Cercophora scortea]|uniref:Uncharacterized protein n=1 Tax=Cercophora scortea TaxID=314031 RepID=A0AAE0MHP0_9PEZI|nr:hypothetical protein B0T19DRAFT_483045 [Cercophora scortea]
MGGSGTLTTTTTTWTAASVTRYNIAPLTTVFVPPPECSACYGDGGANYIDGPFWLSVTWKLCTAYASNCLSFRPCLPGTTTITADFGFYSPGHLCPAGWTTVTVLSSRGTYRAIAQGFIDQLQADETAAICCPRGVDFDVKTTWALAPMCRSTAVSQVFQHDSCSGLESNLQAESLGDITVTGSSTTVIGTSTIPMFSSITTHQYAFTMAPVVQLVWRPSDLEVLTANSTSTTVPASNASIGKSTSGLAVSTGAVAGIVTASVIVALLFAAGFGFWLRKYLKRRGKDVPPGEEQTTNNPHDGPFHGKSGGGVQKPELDAISTVASDAKRVGEKAELEAPGQPSTIVETQIPEHASPFELDATEVTSPPPKESSIPQREIAEVGKLVSSGGEDRPAVSPESQGSPFSSLASPSTMWSPASDEL